MLFITLLNKTEKFKSFVLKKAHFTQVGGEEAIVVDIVPRKNTKPVCRICMQQCCTHATEKPRLYEDIPYQKWKVYFRYSPRRADCNIDGALVELLPWVDGKEHQTKTYRVFLARWARRLSWKETATVFETSWDSVARAVRFVVEYGLANRDLDGIETLGVDEIKVQKNLFLTLVYQLDAHAKRLLWSGEKHKAKTLQQFFQEFGKERTEKLKIICSDMWKAYLTVIREKAPQAIHVLDRFHIMQNINKAIDTVRREEARKYKGTSKEELLKHSRWPLLKNKENLTENQVLKMADLLRSKLKSVKSHLMREDFQPFWQYKSPTWAEKFLDSWIKRTMRSRIEPMKKVARTLREHKELVLNWFRVEGAVSGGMVEGLNLKAKLTMRKAYGYRNVETLQVALYHTLGNLPEPKIGHRFC